MRWMTEPTLLTLLPLALQDCGLERAEHNRTVGDLCVLETNIYFYCYELMNLGFSHSNKLVSRELALLFKKDNFSFNETFLELSLTKSH